MTGETTKPTRPAEKLGPLLIFSVMAACLAATALGQGEFSVETDTADSLRLAGASTDSAARGDKWELEGDDGSPEAIRYQGQRIEYLMDQELILLTGQAWVRYKNIRVEGDTIAFDIRRQQLTVSRNPVLYDNEEAIYGDRMVYNFRSRRGWIYNGTTDFEKGRYWGRRIRQVGDRTLNVDFGRYTTCDAESPHYYFWARRMKIYLDDKLVAQPVAMCFTGIPLLVVPFWILPLRHERRSGFLMPRFGNSAYEGVYVKNMAYYQVLDDRSDLTVSGDYLEYVGWRGNLEARFLAANRISALGNFSYLEDRQNMQRRWSLNADYGHRLGKRTSASGRAAFLSDTRYHTDFSDDLNTRLNRNLRSYLAVNHSWSTGGLSAAADHSHNLDFETKSTRLPEVTVSLYRLDLPGGLVGVSGSSYFINTQTSNLYSRNSHQGWDNTTNLSTALHLFRHITISPRATLRVTWYDRDTSGARNPVRWLYSGGASATTTLYGIMPLGLGPLAGLRHVVQPSLTYTFAPKIDQGRYHVFGAIGRMGEQRQLGVSLGNTFQVKYQKGKRTAKIDLLTVSSSAGYNYLAVEKRWSGISTSASLLPGNHILDLRLYNYYDPYLKRSEYTNLDVGLRLSSTFGRLPQVKNKAVVAEPDSGGLGKVQNTSNNTIASGAGNGAGEAIMAESDSSKAPAETTQANGPSKAALQPVDGGLSWSAWLGLSQGWRVGQGVVQSMIRGSLEANITRNWKVSYGQYYDVQRREMVSQEYSVYRDLHCWEARFSSTRSGIYWFYEIRISLKSIPEIKLQVPKSGRVAY